MKARFTSSLILCFSLWVNSTICQSFVNMASAYGLSVYVEDNYFGAGLSTHDFNRDGWDDFTFCIDNAVLFYQNNGNGTFTQVFFNISLVNDVKHAVWVDYDNDGDSDLYVSSSNQLCRLFRNDNMQLVDVTSVAGVQGWPVKNYGCSWADYDRDGDLDLFQCVFANQFSLQPGQQSYWWSNHLYRNNGNGTFTDVTLVAGVSDGLSLSFQSVWLDYNNDMWPDIYIVNDDGHPNRLYRNNGNGTFTDVSAASGSDVPEVYAMTATAGDFNHDGWEDIYITNIINADCVLLRNNGDETFTDIAQSSGTTLGTWTWGANWMDYDNDTYPDLYVSEYHHTLSYTPNYLLKNLGNETFENVTEILIPGDVSNTYCSAVADWNNDGYPDVAVNNFSPQNAGAWVNPGGSNHWLKVSVQGVVSNGDGIGARISVWTSGIAQVHTVYCGEAYMSQDSQREMFGLGSFTVVDSLVVQWPSGHTDRFLHLPVNQTHHIVEGSGSVFSIGVLGSLNLCPGQSVILDAGGTFASYLWNTGYQGQYLMVNQPGVYYVTITTYSGLTDTSDPMQVNLLEPLVPVLSISPVLCNGSTTGAAEILNPEAFQSFVWNDLYESSFIGDLTSGLHTYNYVDIYDCQSNGFFWLNEPAPIQLQLTVNQPLCSYHNGSVQVTVSGGMPPYILNWFGVNPADLQPGVYHPLITDSNGCTATTSVEIIAPPALEVTIQEAGTCATEGVYFDAVVSGGTTPYTFIWSDGSSSSISSCLNCGSFFSLGVQDINGCQWTSPVIEVPCTAAQQTPSAVVLFPNPAQDYFTLSGIEQKVTVRILDVAGKDCMPRLTITQDRGKAYVHIPFLQSGIYFVSVESDTLQLVLPLQIQ